MPESLVFSPTKEPRVFLAADGRRVSPPPHGLECPLCKAIVAE
jgi:hypothetical protein